MMSRRPAAPPTFAEVLQAHVGARLSSVQRGGIRPDTHQKGASHARMPRTDTSDISHSSNASDALGRLGCLGRLGHLKRLGRLGLVNSGRNDVFHNKGI